MPDIDDDEIGQRIGEDGFKKMVAAFYQRVKTDDLIGPMYPDQDWAGAEERLSDFLIFRFGGSERYLQKRGHPRLRIRHALFVIGVRERDRWLQLMSEAMEETGVDDVAQQHLRAFFATVADFMRNQEE
ncbi:MAG: globin [Pirellulaceae bacterium]